MLIHALLVMHIAVLGYWLGAELVINSDFRFMSRAWSMPWEERDRLLDQVLNTDQHVRYALILQAGSGTVLAALMDYLPGGQRLAIAATALMLAWLLLVEATHRLRRSSAGERLAKIDLGLRYLLSAILVSIMLGAALGRLAMPAWLAAKLGLFAGVVLCGVAIRLALIHFYRAWWALRDAGSSERTEAMIRLAYWRATGILILLWLFIAGIVLLSVLKPT